MFRKKNTRSVNGVPLYMAKRLGLNMVSKSAGGSGTIQIGTEGTANGSSLGDCPFSFAYDYSFYTWIYEAYELGAISREIESIELYFGSMSDASYTMNNQRIYIAHIGSKADWNSALPDVGMGSETLTNQTYVKTNFTRVYTTPEEDGWITFTFDSNFNYNGTDNLVFWWENRDGSYDFGGPRFDIEIKADSVAYKRQDTTYPSGSCFINNERPVIKLNYV